MSTQQAGSGVNNLATLSKKSAIPENDSDSEEESSEEEDIYALFGLWIVQWKKLVPNQFEIVQLIVCFSQENYIEWSEFGQVWQIMCP